MEQGTASTTHDIEAQNDPLVSSITIRLAGLSTVIDGDACIYKIPKNLRDINEKCYIPKAVSLGPYTHGMEGLEFMENVKLRYLEDFLKSSRMSIENLVQFIRDREAKTRACYSSLVNFTPDEFVDIILVDVAFVLTLLLHHWGQREWNFSHLEHGAISQEDIMYDFCLLENQLPLFLLQELFEAVKKSFPTDFNHSFSDLLRFFRMYNENIMNTDTSQYRHLVHLFRQWYEPSETRPDTPYVVQKPQSLTELHEAGVKFKLSSSTKLLDIQFHNGVLEIPRIRIRDSTETVFRNILAFEQCHANLLKDRYITDYIAAMSYLVKTPRDAGLLSQQGILENHIGDNMQVSSLFHNLNKNISYKSETFYETFYYAPLFEKLDKHCENSWKKWIASLKHYFKNPWTIIAVIAATILLLLTFINALCSIISVFRS